MRTFLPFLLAAASLLSSSAFGQISKEREIDEEAMKKADFRFFALGNSYTFYWDMPGLVQQFAASTQPKKRLYTHRLAWGGKNLAYYWNGFEGKGEKLKAELANLLDPRWDAI